MVAIPLDSAAALRLSLLPRCASACACPTFSPLPRSILDKPNVTLQDIAARAGVSAMTASRALRDGKGVRPETLEKVRKAAEELGYVPDPLLSALSYRRYQNRNADHYIIPFVTNWSKRMEWNEYPHYRQLYQGAVAQGEKLGYRVEHFWLREPGITHSSFSRMLYHRGIRGLLIAPGPGPIGHIRLDWAKFAMVTFGYSLKSPALHYVADHQFYSMRLACRQLWHLGYRRLGLFLHEGGDTRSMHQWSAAFHYEQQKAAKHDRVPPLLVSPNVHSQRPAFEKWLRECSPDAVISLEPDIARWISEAGHQLGAEVGFANLDLPDASGSSAGIFQNPAGIGAEAVNFLEMLLRRGEYGIPASPRGMVLKGQWVPGATVRNPPARRAADDRELMEAPLGS